MKGTKNVKTLARDCVKLQGKIQKAREKAEGTESYMEYLCNEYAQLPGKITEAREELAEQQVAVDKALEALTKPLDSYHYEAQYYSRDHEGPRRYSSPHAQAVWDETRRADMISDRLAALEAEAAKTLAQYVSQYVAEAATNWGEFQNLINLHGAKVARIRFILKRDIIDLAELAKDEPKAKREAKLPEPSKITSSGNHAAAVDAKALYEAAKAVKQTIKIKTLPVLNYVLVRLTDDGLKIITCTLTNTEEGKEVKQETVRFWGNGERWETCVPAKPFTDWLHVMAEYKETLCLDFDPSVQILQIKTADSRTEFKCLDAQEFPPLAKVINVTSGM